MAGFVVQAIPAGNGFNDPLYVVDVGRCDVVKAVVRDQVRAGWVRWPGSRQLTVHEDANRILLVEGQPDRAPKPGEMASDWLPGRTGSFRGFEIEFPRGSEAARIRIFVDPLSTRPIFLLSDGKRIFAADKLSTIVANVQGLTCSWGELMETAVLGSTYSGGTSVKEVEQLAPGEMVEISGTEIIQRKRRTYDLDTGAKPDAADAARRLGEALRTAICRTWVDPDGHLLLSGGLDSRLVLGLSEGARKTVSLDWLTDELATARRVADVCGAQLKLMPFRPENYHTRMQLGYLVSGGMHQSALINNLGQAREWRAQGIPAITHGYFHNTIFRGWTCEHWVRFPDLSTPLARYMGPKAHYFDRFGQFPLRARSRVLSFLTPEGRSLLKTHLARLADTIEPVVVDGFDMSFERLLLRNVPRQVYFGIFLGWLEETDVESPVFDQAAWNWYASTHPSDRYRDRSVQRLYQMIDRGLAAIPDFNTGKPVQVLPPVHERRWRNQFWFPAARAIARTGRKYLPAGKSQPKSKAGNAWDDVYRQQPIIEALCAGIEAVKDIPLFDSNAVAASLSRYLAGDSQDQGALWAVATIGQFASFVARPAIAEPVTVTAARATGSNPGRCEL